MSGDGGDGREYPAAPRVGVAAVVVDRGRVLLIRRGQEPMMGAWSLPGGLLEVGETLGEGVVREVREETGLAVQPVEMVATLDRIVRDEAGRVQYHYVLVEWLCVVGRGAGSDPCCGDDATDVRWAEREELGSGGVYCLTPETLDVIDQAMRLVGRA